MDTISSDWMLPPEALKDKEAERVKMLEMQLSEPYDPAALLAKSQHAATAFTRCASHIAKVLDPKQREKSLAWLTEVMAARANEFDAIAVCGLSGVLAGQPVALALKKRLLVVRKATDPAHSLYKTEGVLGSYEDDAYGDVEFNPVTERVAIVDDLIDTGATMDWIVQQLRESKQRPVRIFLYNATCFGGYSTCHSNNDSEFYLPITSNLTEKEKNTKTES